MKPFEKQTLIPCIVQSAENGQVLMLAYLNEEAYNRTLATGELTFFSRSRQQLWVKGETSGNRLRLQKLTWDCDADTLLAQVLPSGPVCHTGDTTCFEGEAVIDFKLNTPMGNLETSSVPSKIAVLTRLFDCIEGRKKAPKAGAYTSYLFDEGLDKILKKVGEETAEVIIASKNSDAEAFLGEAADLIYHLFVLLAELGLRPEAVYEVLAERERKA